MSKAIASFIISFLFISCCFGFLAVSYNAQNNGPKPTPTPTPKVKPTPTPTPAPACAFGTAPSSPSFFFGYYSDIINGIDSSSVDAGDTNVCWINANPSYNIDDIIQFTIAGLCHAAATGRKSVVQLDRVCFGNFSPTIHYALLAPDWQTRLLRFAIALQPYKQYICAMYPIDEPYELALGEHVSSSVMTTQLYNVTSAIRQDFQGSPVAVITNPYSIVNHLDTTMFDWVGFDFYSDFHSGGQGVEYYESLMESNFVAGQRAILVPYAYVGTADDVVHKGPYVGELDRIQQATEYYDLAERDNNIIGIFPFLFWNSQPGGALFYGVSGLPGLRATYQTIGKALPRS